MNRGIFALALCLCLLPVAQAQDGGDKKVDELLRRLDKQEKELEELKGEVKGLREGAAPGEAPDAPQGKTDAIRLGMFYAESADKRFRVDLKGRVIAEYRLSDHGHEDFDNSFEARQVRLNLKGKLWERVTFQIALEFGGGASDPLRQGWVNFKLFDWIQFKGGQDKVPLSFTFLEPFKYMNHPEWPMVVGNEFQNFDVGIQVWGWLLGKKIKYTLAAFNGNGPNNRRDSDDEQDYIARVEVIPLKYLNIHVAGAFTPTEDGATGPRDARTLGNQHTRFVAFDAANRRRRYRERATAGAAFRRGPFEIVGEFFFSRHRDMESAGGERMNLTQWSYYLEAVYILTGEDKKRTIAKVDAPLYDPSAEWGTGAWGPGAMAVALRFEDFQIEKDAFDRGFATGTDKARAMVATVSWWPFQVLRYSLSYSWTYFDDRVADSTGRLHHDDHIVAIRAWLTF